MNKMESILVKIIRILIITSIPEVFCANFIQSHSDCNAKDKPIEDKRIFAHVIFRHGERNINKAYPNDPYKEEIYWPGDFGALTIAGKQEVYSLGKYLRKRYRNLLDDRYSPKKVYIHSSNFDRTLMSAQLMAAGLFPPGEENWHKHINWQPIPVHTSSLNQERLLPWINPCPRFNFLIEQCRTSPEYLAIIEKYRKQIRKWEEYSGKSLEKLADVFSLHDTLFIENQRGFILPKWAEEALITNNTLRYLATFHLQSFTNTTELKKLEAGFLIKEMLDRFKEKISSRLSPDRTLWLYSAHDLTIINILNALDLFDFQIPPYASSLHFELYRGEIGYYVQLFYRKTDTEMITPLEIPNCGVKCSLDEFYEQYKSILPNDMESFETACQHS